MNKRLLKRAMRKYIAACRSESEFRRLYDPDLMPYSRFIKSRDARWCRLFFNYRVGTDEEIAAITGIAGADLYRSAPCSRHDCVALAYAFRLTTRQTNHLLNTCGFGRLRKSCADDAVYMQLLKSRAEDEGQSESFDAAFCRLRREYEESVQADSIPVFMGRSTVICAEKAIAAMKKYGAEVQYLPAREQMIFSLAAYGADIDRINSVLRIAAQEPLNPYCAEEARLLFELSRRGQSQAQHSEDGIPMNKNDDLRASAFCVCVPGQRHLTHRQQCQDRAVTAAFDGGAMAVLSDGAGSSQYSQFAAEANTQTAAQFFRTHDIDEWITQSEEQMAEDIAFVTGGACREQADLLRVRPELMSATLVGAVVAYKKRQIVIFHTGDGECGHSMRTVQHSKCLHLKALAEAPTLPCPKAADIHG
ncbi:MAG: protein phosphatase 2C domain-containing protein [Ruminococcaceae bacterium]|nr:protein phosphatase 2C domain-containing protein [Oscillospiraceae bacterium]